MGHGESGTEQAKSIKVSHDRGEVALSAGDQLNLRFSHMAVQTQTGFIGKCPASVKKLVRAMHGNRGRNREARSICVKVAGFFECFHDLNRLLPMLRAKLAERAL